MDFVLKELGQGQGMILKLDDKSIRFKLYHGESEFIYLLLCNIGDILVELVQLVKPMLKFLSKDPCLAIPFYIHLCFIACYFN